MRLHVPNHPAMTLLPDGPPRIMGVLNLTPDSFSDGGRYPSIDAAVAHALAMVEAGADVIDVGGESTRPGSQRIPAEEQIRRVVEPIRRIHEAIQQPQLGGLGRVVGLTDRSIISIDTTHSAVARAALEAGAGMLNDISAGREDPAILELAAAQGVPIVLMHMLGEPATMQTQPQYDDVVREVRDFLLERAAAAERAGVPRPQIVLDPGIGFGKTTEHNLALLAHLRPLVDTGYPVLLGVSRKRFIGTIAGGTAASDPAAREPGTTAITALGVTAGVQLIRVHDVAANRQAADVAWAISRASTTAS